MEARNGALLDEVDFSAQIAGDAREFLQRFLSDGELLDIQEFILRVDLFEETEGSRAPSEALSVAL